MFRHFAIYYSFFTKKNAPFSKRALRIENGEFCFALNFYYFCSLKILIMMIMKRIAYFVMLICITVIFACDSKKNGYVLSGVVPDEIEDGELVYMTDYHEGVVVNSAVVSRKKFVFKGAIDTAKAIMLSV